MCKQLTAAAIVLCALSGPADAASAPAPLREKSIIVAWSENRVQRWVGETTFRSVTIQHEVRMYISAGGRVFSRMTNTNPRGQSGSQDDVSGERGSNRVPQFSGQSMSFTMATGGPHAARKIVVNFDASFGNCTADAVRGKQPGANTTIGRSMITGRMNEIQSASVSAVSCRVQAGNVFGGG